MGLDMAQVATATHRMYSFLSVCHSPCWAPMWHDFTKSWYAVALLVQFAWAIIADIDIESEKWRCCGAARFTWGGIVRALCLRKYRGELWYLPATAGPTTTAGATAASTGASKDAVASAISTAEVKLSFAAGGLDSAGASLNSTGVGSTAGGDRLPFSIPPLDQPLDASWKVWSDANFIANEVAFLTSCGCACHSTWKTSL